MREIVRRAMNGRPELTAELLRRGMFRREEKAELIRCRLERHLESVSSRLGSVQFATFLALGDVQLAARAVLRNVLNNDELRWLDRMLRFPKPNKKRDELIRIIERKMEGREGNVRRGH